MNIIPIEIVNPANGRPLPTLAERLSCGFPSPAADYACQPIDLHEHLIKRPNATFFAWANGDSLKDLGIMDGDLLIVDRGIKVRSGDVVVANIDGEFCCRILDKPNRVLRSANESFEPIAIGDDMDLIIEGVIIHAVHHLRLD